MTEKIELSNVYVKNDLTFCIYEFKTQTITLHFLIGNN